MLSPACSLIEGFCSRNEKRGLYPFIILSIAKDLSAMNIGEWILHFVQHDKGAPRFHPKLFC